MNLFCRWIAFKSWTPAMFARRAGVHITTISHMLKPDVRHREATIRKYAPLFGATFEEFLAGPPAPSSLTVTPPPIPLLNMQGEQVGELSRELIPILGSLPAGPWMSWHDSYAPGAGEDFIERGSVKGNHVIGVWVRGDSMEPELHDGDILVLDPEKAFSPRRGGRIGVVKFDGSYKIRRVHLTPDSNNYLLEPANRTHDSEIIPVTGTVIFKIVDVRTKLDERF